MHQSEEEDEGVPPSNSSLSEAHESQTEPERPEGERAGSPVPSNVSMKSQRSMDYPTAFQQEDLIPKPEGERAVSPVPSNVSMKSQRSMDYPTAFQQEDLIPKPEGERAGSPVPSNVSMKSQRSMDYPTAFQQEDLIPKPEGERAGSPVPSNVSMKSQRSMDYPTAFQQEDLIPKPEGERAVSPVPSNVSMKSQRSMDYPTAFQQEDLIPKPEGERAGSPVPSNVSMKSQRSMDYPTAFQQEDLIPKPEGERAVSPAPSNVSIKSQRSMDYPTAFQQEDLIPKPEGERAGSPVPSNVSMKSQRSMDYPTAFQQEDLIPKPEGERAGSSAPSNVSMKSQRSMDYRTAFKQQGSISKVHQESLEEFSDCQSDLDFTFMLLEENIVTFVKNKLKKFKKLLSQNYSECLDDQCEDEEADHGEEEEQRRSSGEAFLKITLQFLRRMKKENLADSLQNRTLAPVCHCKLKSNLKKKYQSVFEGISKAGNPALLNQIYTELYVTEGGTAEVNDEHEVRQIEAASRRPDKPEMAIRCEDIFKGSPETHRPIKTVMTKGVAGIGKTVLTQKFALDWAEDKANQDIQFMFPFTFRELNVLKDKKFSLVGLVHHFFTETQAGICKFEEFRVLFIFDGLDECRLPLDFHNTEILTDVTESTSVDVLLINLIKGNLLPSARLWITTRPAAANQIPLDCVDMVTEVRGFADPQKEEYFKKRYRDEEQASKIISHIKTSRSLHIMCHIPIFCWISATVLEDVLKTREAGELPVTLTEMYIRFLVVQSKLKNVKYDGGTETDPHWNKKNSEMIVTLGKLAFEQLQKGNLIFYESDLAECGIDIREASVYSGVFTQIFKEERGLYQDMVFCFIHLSVQEFLAALHVHLTFINSGINLLAEEKPSVWSKLFRSKIVSFYQSAVDKALQSPNGHLDLFLRFLVGLALPSNQNLLRGLVTQTGSSPQTTQETVQYIKTKITGDLPPERSINLFHCLNELKDSSLVEDIQQYLCSERVCTGKFSHSQWSALVFILLTSGKDLDVFDLSKYTASEEALLRFLPVVKESTKAVLSCCNLSEKSCKALQSVLSSQSSSLKELDLSNNDLRDSGVDSLCAGLESPHCTLEVLRLSGCLITKKGCASLASALRSNPSHLRELDLSYNHPGDSGVKLLSDGLKDPTWRLETLWFDHGGSQSMKSGLRKYACELTPDTNTANRKLIFSDHNRKVTAGIETQPYPDHPERFDYWKQLLCTDGLTGRCYWEVEWAGKVYIGVTYKGIKRRGQGDDCCLGKNDQSWSLCCSEEGYTTLHSNKRVSIDMSCPALKRVGVYLDWPAGILSFYRVSDKLTLIKTFHTTFTEPVYPAFRIRVDPFNSSVSLCVM